jgi:hypothetical protein
MPQSCDMGQTALLPHRRKACWGFFRPKNPTASAGFETARTVLVWSVNWWRETEGQMNWLTFWQCTEDWLTDWSIDRLNNEWEGEGLTNRFAHELHSRLCNPIGSMVVVLRKKHAISLVEIQNSSSMSLKKFKYQPFNAERPIKTSCSEPFKN